MDAGDLFGSVVVAAIGIVILLALSGRDPGPFLDFLPQIVLGAFFVAMIVAFVQIIE